MTFLPNIQRALHPRNIELLLELEKFQEELPLRTFINDHNLWRSESYFLGQITVLHKHGLIETTGTRDRKIKISQKGRETLEKLWQ